MTHMNHLIIVTLALLSLLACEIKEAPKEAAAPPPATTKTTDTESRRSSPVASYEDAVKRIGSGVVTIRALTL